MRQFFAASALIAVVALGACSRASSDIDKMQPGTAVTVTMKDGTAVSGRLVQAKADALVVDPAEGGEWRTLPRDQVASVNVQQPAGQPQPGASAAGEPQPSTPAASATVPGRPESQGSRPRRTIASGASRSTAAEPPAVPAPAASAPAFREVTLPADTLLHVRLDTQAGSDTSRVEDPVRASVVKPVVIEGVEVVPVGSTLSGVVTQATPSGKVKGRAELAFRFDTLTAGGDERRVQTRTVAIEAPATKKSDALKIGVPAAGGAILGGLLGGKKGAVIGGAVGGGAGTAVVLNTPGKEVHLPAGSAVTVKLLEPVTVRVPVER